MPTPDGPASSGCFAALSLLSVPNTSTARQRESARMRPEKPLGAAASMTMDCCSSYHALRSQERHGTSLPRYHLASCNDGQIFCRDAPRCRVVCSPKSARTKFAGTGASGQVRAIFRLPSTQSRPPGIIIDGVRRRVEGRRTNI